MKARPISKEEEPCFWAACELSARCCCPFATAVRSLLSTEEKRGRSYQQQVSTAPRPLEVASLFVWLQGLSFRAGLWPHTPTHTRPHSSSRHASQLHALESGQFTMIGTRLSRPASAPALQRDGSFLHRARSAPTLKPTAESPPKLIPVNLSYESHDQESLRTLKASTSAACLNTTNPYITIIGSAKPAASKTPPKHARLYQHARRRSVVGASNRPHIAGVEQLYSLTAHLPKTPATQEKEDSRRTMHRFKTTVVEPPLAAAAATVPDAHGNLPPPHATPQQTALFAGAPSPMPTPFAKVEQGFKGSERKQSLLSQRAHLVKVTGREVRDNYYGNYDGSPPGKRKPAGAQGEPAPEPPRSPEQRAAEGAAVKRIMEHLRKHLCSRRVLRPIFRAMDEDLSGSLDYAEFAKAMRRLGVNAPRGSRGSGEPLASAAARLPRLLRARLAALGSSALPGRGRPTGRPATASGARASLLQSRQSHRLGP